MGSITDKPISSKKDDLLEVAKYSRALSKFIVSSETPITIGLQGEWGTGKTSLMKLLLEDFLEIDIACSWINTWEYSIFREVYETTPQVLSAMLEKLKESCKERNIWSLKDDAEQNYKKVASFIGSIANQIVAKHTGADLKSTSSDVLGGSNDKPRAEIAEIKELISKMIQALIDDEKNPIQKVVFFVDDLDRIPPTTAVEVLEALKNIFDIPNCVFVLAIDYDVVVKGLESKFGKKTDSNEREFRSFFDKIIQVPFSMPTGAYNIENLLVKKLSDLGVSLQDEDIERYTKAIKYTVGYNPRSLKRFLNSFSLINHLKEEEGADTNRDDDFLLFATLGIQITYPKVFRFLAQEPNFTKWDRHLIEKIDLEWDEIQQAIKKYGDDNKLLNDEWEQVTWGICQSDPYVKSKVFDVLELLNLLEQNYSEDLEEKIGAAMTFATITSIDDDIETKQSIRKIGNVTLFNDFDTWLSEMKNGQLEDKQLGVKMRKPVTIPKLNEDIVRRIYNDFNSTYPNRDGLISYKFSPTGGCTIYYKAKKFAGFGFSTREKIELFILRNPNKYYYKPHIKGLNIDNHNESQITRKRPWGYEFFKVLDSPEKINKNIHVLIKLMGDGIQTVKDGNVLPIKKDEFLELKPIYEGTYNL